MYMYVFVSAVTVLVATMIFNPDVVFDAMGRDASLTGRVPLWQVVIGIIAEKPVFGHAYGGFFTADSIDLQYLWLQFPWQPPHAHSGYLDMMVDLGIVGLLLYLWLFSSTIFLGLKALYSGTLPLARWVLFFMLINVLMNIDEDTSMIASMFTALMPSAMLEVGIWSARRKAASRRPQWAIKHPDGEADQSALPERLVASSRFLEPGQGYPIAGTNQGSRADNRL
jgi:exopolysaccharide production protein ExoQ